MAATDMSPPSAIIASAASKPGIPRLAWLFLAYALPTIIFLAVTMAPFQVADEYAHALRADQVSRGQLISHQPGGIIDGAVYAFGHLYQGLPFHYDAKVSLDISQQAGALSWSLPDHDENFQNTAQYGPFLYLPQAAAILIAKAIGLDPAWTMLSARLVNGLVASLIGFLALCICRRAMALTFVTLLLPMTMSEFASLSQDALLISFAIFAAALISRTIAERRQATIWEFGVFAAIIVASTMARPSQIALTALGLGLFRGPVTAWLPKAAIVVVALACVVGWFMILPGLMPELPPGASAAGQFRVILSSPLAFPMTMLNTLEATGTWLFHTLIGRLGWVDTPLPEWFYEIAPLVLICAWLAPGNSPPYFRPALIATIAFFAVLLAISAALYISWTPVGKATIGGVQGRYMLTVLPLVAWLAPSYSPRLGKLLSPTWVVVVLFPLLSLAVLPSVIMARYYGSWAAMADALKALFLT